jgi:hypothetical protein
MMRYALPCAGLLAISGTGCAARQSADSPTARHVQGAQERSQQALDNAAKAQERATEQGERVAQAQREVQEAQRRLTEAQRKLESEQQKAEELQQQAIQARREATEQAEVSQREASRALATQGELVDRQEQTFSGQVSEATSDALVVTPQSGEPMTFKVTNRTQVQIDGRQATAAEVRQGADARVAYQMSGAGATATTIQVISGGRGQAQQPPAAEREATTPTEPSSPPPERR